MIPKGLFISPDNGQLLQWIPQEEVLQTATGQFRYSFKGGLAVLLPQQAPAAQAATAAFNYVDHYQKDAELFDYFAGWEDPAAVHENHRLHEMILAQKPPKAQRILDVGCGSAWVAAHFAGQGVGEVFSLDVSTVNPQKALARYPFSGHFGVVADVFHLPFADASFDFIIASEIIEHVADPAGFLRCLLRVLAPGGRLVVTTPHAEKIAYSLCIHCNQPTPHHAHLHTFTQEHLRQMLPKSVQGSARTKVFMNKLLLHGRTHSLLKHVPFRVWQWIDQLANFFVPKTARLLLTVERP